MTITMHPTEADALAYIDTQTSPDARALTAMFRTSYNNPQHAIADPTNNTVWHAQGTLDIEVPWTVTSLNPAEAVLRFRHKAIGLENVLGMVDASPEAAYQSEDALGEYYALLRMMLPADPRDAADVIKKQQDLARRDQARWSRVYAAMVRELVGDERGGQARAARELGISEVQVGRILAEDDARSRY